MIQDAVVLSEDDVLRVHAWLARHCNGKCPVCHEADLDVEKYVAEMRCFRSGELSLKDKVYPYVVVLCATCGHVMLFSAITLGCVSKREAEHG